MDYRNLSLTGPAVSRIALGAMTFGAETDEDMARLMLDEFVAAGGTLVDTADVYSDGTSEEWIGRWLRANPYRREQIVLATKGRFAVSGQPGAGLSKKYLHVALDASLRRLDVDHVDLYQAHGPDNRTELSELLEFFDEAVASGKATHVGVSNFTGWQIATLAAQARADTGPVIVAHQPQYSLLVREVEWEVMPAAIHHDVGAIVWGPQAAGWLTGKYRRDQPPPVGSRLGDDPDRGLEAWSRRATPHTWAVLETLRSVAEEAEVTPAQAALAWVTERPGVRAAIVGARTVEQLRNSLAAAEVRLTGTQTARLDAVSVPNTPDYPYRFAAELAERTG
ncbi:MAG TPA: aldo/keto reductase [Mycobacteriales bacterium]